MSKRAKRFKTSKNQRAGQELSDDQLEAVAGGVSLGASAAPELGGEAAEKGKSSPVLLRACATGEHIKEATITVRR